MMWRSERPDAGTVAEMAEAEWQCASAWGETLCDTVPY